MLTVELRINLLAPAGGEVLRATGRVLRSGRTLTVCQGEVVAVAADGSTRQVATAPATMITARPEGADRYGMST